ncbi:alpha/beta hydrolase [Streptomyces sp. NPDC089919]|uniref:alpha/beta fold hydrolase n=1 Tax=Streptomyces sp. NPDC089919 TaxID=3155188 RepID=UPI00343DAFB8
MSLAPIVHRYVDVGDVCVFYRETGPVDAPVLLLLHGFPSGSQQYKRLMAALGGEFRVIAPDYPGSGRTEVPAGFTYSFEALAEVTEGFVEALGLDRFTLYLFDFGAPVGFRLAERQPARVAGLIVQNGNAYKDGLSYAAREFIALRRENPGDAEHIRGLATLAGSRFQYEAGVPDAALLDPDAWTLDQHFLDLPGRKEAQVDLALDYRSNVSRYPVWQAWLRAHRPPALILWGTGDPFFTEAGARAYLRDLPDAAMHLFPTGHFALETHLPQIAPLVADFLRGLRRPVPAAPEPAVRAAYAASEPALLAG